MKYNVNKLFVQALLCTLLSLFQVNAANGQEIRTGQSSPSANRDKDIKGVVTGISGEPVSECTVANRIKRTTTRTDNTGRFLIEAEIGDVLQMSHTNYEIAEYMIKEEDTLVLIKLFPRDRLEEEVVVYSGYQKTSKARTTGAFSKVDSSLLEQQVSSNILDRLKNVSNVYFDTKNLSTRTTNITIRGFSTINGNMSPLIILDNFPYSGNISDINPDDIESVTILKDATAASIWGAKSANGVVVLTSKKSRYNQPVTVDFNTTFSINAPPDFFKKPDMSIADYIDVEQFLFNRNYRLTDTANRNRPPLTPVYEMLLAKRYGQITAIDSASFIKNLLAVDPAKEYRNAFYQNAITNQYSLSLKGGGKIYSWLITGAMNTVKSNLKLNESNKKNFRIENKFQPFKGFEIGLNLFYTYQTDESAPTPTYNSVTIGSKNVPYLTFTDPFGAPVPIDKFYRGSFLDTLGGGKLLDWKYYPYNDYTFQNTNRTVQNLLMALNLGYHFLKHFDFSLNYQLEQQQINDKTFYDRQSYYARNLINLFSARGATVNDPITLVVPFGDILSRSSQKSRSKNIRAQLNYSNTWGNFQYTGLAGWEMRQTKSFDGYGASFYGYNEDPLTYGYVDFNTRYRTFITGNLQGIPNQPRELGNVDLRFVSGFMNNEFSFKKKYILNASLRSDASNIFGLSTNDKWNPFWSLGTGWVISKENFFRIRSISLLKFRTTLGIGGNVDPTRSALPVGTSVTNSVTNYYVVRIAQLNNPSLKWEESRQINFALDFSVLNQRLSGSVDYYIKKGTDLYGPSLIDYTAWGKANSIVKNVAAMKGNGVEVSLQSKNLIRPFLWNTNLIFNYNVSKTTDYYATNAENIYSYIGSGGSITPIINKPLYAFAAFRWGGLNSKGDPQGFINGASSTDYQKITAAANNGDSTSIVYVGQADPKVFGALINSFQFHGWTASINISYKLGHYFKRPSLNYSNLFASGIGNAEYSKRWQNPGDEQVTTVPALVYSNYPQFTNRNLFYENSEINFLPADNVRLEYINLGYSFNNMFKNSSFLNRLTLIGNISNLGIIWRKNKEGLDPDNYYTFTPPAQFSITLRAGL